MAALLTLAGVTLAGSRPEAAHAAVFDNGEWVVTELGGAGIPERAVRVTVDGQPVGRTKLLGVASRTGPSSFPQVLVIAASGYLRLKPGADPDPALPFGQSLVLGPAVFATSSRFPQPTLFSNPQLQRIDVSTDGLRRDGTGALTIRLSARDRGLSASSNKSNQVMNLRWRITLGEPTRERTEIRINGRFKFTERLQPAPERTAERQSFRLMQVSSMFIDDERHDVDVLRFRSPEGLVRLAYDPAQADSLLPADPLPFARSAPVLDSLHTDDRGEPNGNTPSYRIRILEARGPISGPLTPRAYFVATDDLNDDNLGLWINRRPATTIRRGTRGRIALSVLATADPLPAATAWTGLAPSWP